MSNFTYVQYTRTTWEKGGGKQKLQGLEGKKSFIVLETGEGEGGGGGGGSDYEDLIGLTGNTYKDDIKKKKKIQCLEVAGGVFSSLYLPNHQRWYAKMVVQLQYIQYIYTHIAYTFFASLVPICMLSRCLLAKFLHRSSVGSLSRVRCWLGSRRE